ncbi:MAG TPA: pyruvate kinase [Candidatus Kapabacteria bacterium]|nr:pyruvate kinase [Candidatus Kapabacteria bacterium]
MRKRTKIVCTIGPACQSVDTITRMVHAGMNVARLNFSHGTYDNHAMLLKHVRAVEKKTGEPIAILQDLQGPKIRVGMLPEEGIELEEGKKVIFDTGTKKIDKGSIPIDYHDLHHFVKKGERILLNDGRSEVLITSVKGTKIEGKVVVGGLIISHKGINVPDSNVGVRALTEKDKEDAIFGIKQGVDLIAMSFVRTAEDVLDLRYFIRDQEKVLGMTPPAPIRIIAKIERREAVEHIHDILDVVDGIMVARGDLGIEIDAADVPLVQKKLIDAALAAGKPVIVATQMLDSMQNNPRPTRAEVSDVANAVIDHTDAVMLSNETATGKYPVETVAMMAEIIEKTEASSYDDVHHDTNPGGQPLDEVMSELSKTLAERVDAKAIVAASISGDTGRLLSRHRPQLPVMVATNTVRVQHQLNLSWGVEAFLLPKCNSIEELVDRSMVHLKKQKKVVKKDQIVVVAGEPVGHAGHVNLLEVREVR